ncbi:MAG: D-alanine--D-alanine ligase [Actinobacteria bacterium]|nr:D-alanine--D-alanine ligase [Actinomycetota bacterium]
MRENLLEKFKNLQIRSDKSSIRVGVIAGGISTERDISLSTGKGIYESLLRSGYDARFIDFKDYKMDIFKTIDIVFIALHGKYGEDGTVQGLLELLKIPYTGSGVLASAIAMDKIFTKKIFCSESILTPDFEEVTGKSFLNMEKIKYCVLNRIGYPVIVKPNRGGSTIGVTIVNEEKKLEEAVGTALIYDSKALIEKFISGKLLTVSIVGDEAISLPIIEIKPKSGFYDYQAKYTAGFTDYIVPAQLDTETSHKISEIAENCFTSLGCGGYARVDFIMSNDKKVYALEVNTIPGMTPTSLVPKAALACGLNYDWLVEIILNYASLKL